MPIDWTKPIRRVGDKTPCVFVGRAWAGDYMEGEYVVSLPPLKEGGPQRFALYNWRGHHKEYSCRNEYDLENIPEPPKYRPYADTQMASLVGKIVIHKTLSMRSMVTSYTSGDVWIVDTWKNADQLLADWQHEDGTPCGVLVGGEA